MAPATWVVWIGNAWHVLLNWVLIFGKCGFPALGLLGAAYATTLSHALLLGGLWAWTVGFGLHRGAWRPWDRQSVALGGLWQVVRLGAPVGAQMSLEGWAFGLATMMAGWLGTAAVGAHQVVLNLASLTFMVPLGVAQGTATRVGNLIGARDGRGMRAAVLASLALGPGVMTLSAVLMTVLRHELPLLYTEDSAVLALGAGILPLAGAFQVFDGTQVVSGGALRGMGKPDAPAWINLLGYFALALPLGYLVAFPGGRGLGGIWFGLAVGLVCVALGLVFWVLVTARRPLDELGVAVRRGAPAGP
jgi:MATE family multidrug resistance protein